MADTPMDRPKGSGSSAHNPSARGGNDRPGGSDLSGRARETLDEARQQASSLASHAKDSGKALLNEQKEGAAEQVQGFAEALHSTAEDLQRRSPEAGRFVGYAADRLETFGQQLRNRDLDSFIDDASRWGRNSPAAFFAGAMAVGFLLSRFLKSSASAQHSDTYGNEQRRSNPLHGQSNEYHGRGSTSERRQASQGARDWSWTSGSGSDSRASGAGASSALTSPPLSAGSAGSSDQGTGVNRRETVISVGR